LVRFDNLVDCWLTLIAFKLNNTLVLVITFYMTINSLVPRLILFPFEIPKLHLITVLIFSDQAKRRCILYALGGKLRRATFAPNF
jgi:hypothetical protein